MSPPLNLRKIAKLGDTIKFTNGDIVTVMASRSHMRCSFACYFKSHDRCLRNSTFVCELIPDFYKYIWMSKTKVCFLKSGWYFKLINKNNRGGV